MKVLEAPFRWKLSIGLSLAALVIWFLYLFLVNRAFCTWEDKALFGETFGALSALFSILAFAGVLFTLFQDRKARQRSTRIEAYEALLRSIENQLKVAQQSGADELAIGDLFAKQRLYSEELETLITEERPKQLLTDDDVIDAFVRIPWFSRADIAPRVRGIRQRLQRWSIATPEDVNALVNDDAIKQAITDLYTTELLRDPKTPFDPDALAVWGGLFFRRGLTDDVRESVRATLQGGPEWKAKHP